MSRDQRKYREQDKQKRHVERSASKGYTCPYCHRTSHNPNDAIFRYCGGCHRYAP